MIAVGIDIGGMSVKAGLVDGNGTIIGKNVMPTAKTPQEVIDNIIIQIKKLCTDYGIKETEIKGIGIGCPGTVSSSKGIVDNAENLGWKQVNVTEKIKSTFYVPTKISNDANLAILGEVKFGCANKYSDCVMFTLGTGVGGGIVIDNKLYEGRDSKGAELGHITLVCDGEPCNCGRKGCIEAYCSASALIRQTKQAMLNDKNSAMWEYVKGNIDNVDGRTSFECAKNGDKTAIRVVDKYTYYLSQSIMSMLNIFRPQAFIIGGGISAQGKYLIDKIKGYCEKEFYGFRETPKCELLTATLGNDAGIIGAAALVL